MSNMKDLEVYRIKSLWVKSSISMLIAVTYQLKPQSYHDICLRNSISIAFGESIWKKARKQAVSAPAEKSMNEFTSAF